MYINTDNVRVLAMIQKYWKYEATIGEAGSSTGLKASTWYAVTWLGVQQPVKTD